MEKSLWKKKQDTQFGVWYLENQLTGAIEPLSTTTTPHHSSSTETHEWGEAGRFDIHHSPAEKNIATTAAAAAVGSQAVTTSELTPAGGCLDDDVRHWYESWSAEHLCAYYYNPVTEESSWTVPGDAIVHRMDSPSKLAQRLLTADGSDDDGVGVSASSDLLPAVEDTAEGREADRCFRKLRFGGLSMMTTTTTTTTTTTAAAAAVTTTGSNADDANNKDTSKTQQLQQQSKNSASSSASSSSCYRPEPGVRRFGTSIAVNIGAPVGAGRFSNNSKILAGGGGGGVSRFRVRITGRNIF